MFVTSVPERIESVPFHKSGEDRTPGLHLSDIIKSVMIDLDPKTYNSGLPMDMNRVELGFTFEGMLEQAFSARRMDILRIGEVVRDGVIMSPDGLDPGDPPVLHEFKCTWKSCRETPTPCGIHTDIRPDCNMCSTEFGPKFFPWILQIMSYCYALDVTDAELRAFFVNGDYRNGSTPQYRCWRFKFTEEELAKKWQFMLAQAEKKGLRKAHV